jgi:outer membrane protein
MIVALGAWVPCAAAQSIRIGYVNVVKTIEQAPQGDAALKKLEAEFGPKDRDLKALRDRIRAMEAELEAGAGKVTDAERAAVERDVFDLKRELKRTSQEVREDYNLRRNEELAALQTIVYKVIVEIAKAEHYDLIIHEGAIYASDAIDITDKVLEKLREQ